MKVVNLKENFFVDESVVERDVKIKDINVAEEIAKFPFIPYESRVFVVEEEIEQVGGLYVPPSARDNGEMQTNIGWVVGVGPDVLFCVPGDRIYYGRYSGALVMEKKYRVMNEKDILGKFKDARET